MLTAALALVAVLDVVLLGVARDSMDAAQDQAGPLFAVTLAAAVAPFLCFKAGRVFRWVTFATSGVLLVCCFFLYVLGALTFVAAVLHLGAAVASEQKPGRTTADG